ncbi:hypothetical protein [Rickettsia sibirica]|uniref:hypothetical protein n=1 Tax=Rickettsia sibirica TaxID=35793 RepID=UPI000379540B
MIIYKNYILIKQSFINKINMLKSENIQKSDKAPKVISEDTFFRPYGLPSYSIYYMDDGTTIYRESESPYYYDKVKIDNQEVTKGTDKFLGKYRGFDCYGTMSKKIYNTFDKSKVTSFVSALKKGIIYHKHGVTGVKLIKENAFKAKWDCDD